MVMLPFITALFLLLPQEKLEDNSWLRSKPGTFLKSKMTIDGPGWTREDVQTLTLKEVDGDEYVIEESYASAGSKPTLSRRARGVKTGTETLTIAGKAYDCTVTVVKGKTEAGPTEAKFWTPAGSKNAVKVVFKQPDGEGEVVATAVDEKVKALGRTLVCTTLEGKSSFGEVKGTIRVVLCEDIPGSQVRAEFVMKGAEGDTKVRFEAIEINEKK
jgi:hypothetical protein